MFKSHLHFTFYLFYPPKTRFLCVALAALELALQTGLELRGIFLPLPPWVPQLPGYISPFKNICIKFLFCPSVCVWACRGGPVESERATSEGEFSPSNMQAPGTELRVM